MEAAAPYLVSALRARPVTGIFLVINTHDLAEKEVGSPMPSVYLRDLDPDARPSDCNTDLMLERSSAAVVKALGITTDKSWSTALNYRGLTNGSFVRTVFQTAWEDDEKLDAADYGAGSPRPTSSPVTSARPLPTPSPSSCRTAPCTASSVWRS